MYVKVLIFHMCTKVLLNNVVFSKENYTYFTLDSNLFILVLKSENVVCKSTLIFEIFLIKTKVSVLYFGCLSS